MAIDKINAKNLFCPFRDVLFSRTRGAVLYFLFRQPDRSFYFREIVRVSQTGIGTVHREVKELEKAGFLISRREGNKVFYQANTKLPIFNELVSITTKTFDPEANIRAAFEDFGEKIIAVYALPIIEKDGRQVFAIKLRAVFKDLNNYDLNKTISDLKKNLGLSIESVLFPVDEFLDEIKSKQAYAEELQSEDTVFMIGSLKALHDRLDIDIHKVHTERQ